MAHICKSQNLGSTKGLRQQKAVWTNDGMWGTPSLTLYCRDTLYSAYAEFCGPDDILDTLWGDIQACTNVGLGAATLASIFTSPGAALPAFEAGFKGCLATKINERVGEIQVNISIRDETGDWGAC